ncbi:MAG: Ig-like domain-containing protein [Bacteroidaceae bacterium]|nr:Ig-like domain-containing protein [Bacteroidaceae bacterium]
MKKKLNLLVLFALAVFGLRAQYVAPSEGVFRIVNVGYNAALMENYENNNLRCTTTIGDEDDFDQLWILKKEGSGYSIQNAYTGAYIQTGNTGTEVPYWTGATPKTFTITLGGSKKGYNIFDPSLKGQGLHSKGGNGNVVRWVDCEASEWQFAAVEVSKEAMELAQAEYAEYLKKKTEFENRCEELLANLDNFEVALAKYFEDAACTVLKEEFASAKKEDLVAAMTADNLPAELIAMAVKVNSNEWAEDNEKADKPGWDANYAKKFRVQMIEPHSIAGEITEWIGHQGHTNMDNPTGLYANNHQVLYIMVSDTIKEGAELWATWIVGHSKMPNYNNGYGNSGVRLKQGLNIVPIRSNGSALYFNYLVHTYDKNKRKFTNKLSDHADLKIHVEGGYINGYYNVAGDELYTPDNDDDWVYYEERANLENITILGRYEVLQFELNDVVNYTDDKGSTWSEKGLAYYFPEQLPTQMPNSPAFTAPNQRINGIVEAWDRIFLSEKMTLGVASRADVDSMNKLFPRLDGNWENPAEIYNYDDALEAFCDSIKDRDGDYGEYYNHRGVAFGTRTGYMYGSWDHSGYHINTTHSILTCIATEAGPTWGPAHEIGHQHQALYTLNGEMEVTNNTFANIAAWYMGMGTSRVNGTEGNLAHVYDNFKSGGYLLSNNIWALTQRYYRLWLYYHRVGNNTQFFPRLFELIRQKPMERSYGSGSEMQRNEKTGEMEEVGFQLTNGYKSYLHFYQLCCEAAQEDLTEFFRAYGCFEPVNGVFQGDYTNSKYYTTQQEIDKAIAEVKAKGYPVNNKVLFINDCTKGVTYGHDGKTRRSYWDSETGRGENGEVGLYVDYLKGTPITGEYVYSLVNLKLTVEGGQGAVGFAVYDKEGAIRAFSNNHTFSLNKETANMLRSGEATLYAVAATDEDVVVINKALQGTAEQQLKKLQDALKIAKNYLEKTDNTGTKIGYLIPDSVADYVSLVAKIDSVIEFADTTEYKYGEWYINLDAATAGIQANSAARVPLKPNNFYSISLSSNTKRYLDIANAGLKTTLDEAEEISEDRQWRFINAEEEGTYYIQHRSSGNYITSLASGKRAEAKSTDIEDAVAFTVVSAEAPGDIFIQSTKNENVRLYNVSSNNQAWAGNQTGSNAKWAIKLADDLTSLPNVSTDEELVIYYLIRNDNGEYAYSYLPKSKDKGRIATDMNNDLEDFNYWFYFKQGSQQGKYTAYNYGTGKAITEKEGKLYVDKEAETLHEFAMALNEEGTGLTMSTENGNWYMKMGSTTELIEISAEDRTAWKLQRVRTISLTNEPISSLTISKTKATLTEGDSITLTVETGPVYATNHTVTWSSSDTTIAVVDSTGKVKAIAAGKATITATANDDSGLTATCEVTVQKKDSGIFTVGTTTLSIQSKDGVITIEGLAIGTVVSAYDITGKQITTFTATSGTATIHTGMNAGTAIVKVGEYSVKVSL